MKDVLALVTPVTGDILGKGTDYALSLARDHGAHLSALVAEIETYPSTFLPHPDNMQADETAIERPSLKERLGRTTELVLSAANLANVRCEILRTNDEFVSLRERVVFLAQLRDVLVIDQYGPLQSPRKDLVDGALFGSGRPIILVPQSVREFAQHKILVAWDATRSAVRAVHDALPLLVRARDVTIVSVIDDKAFSAANSGDALRHYLARWHVDAKFEAINREHLNVGMALLAHAGRAEADLLVMGGFAHGFERELMHGSATRDVFRESPEIPVFLSH